MDSAAQCNEEKLREACCYGDLDALANLVQKGVNVNSCNDLNGWTGLHWACERGLSSIVDLLLRSGADATIVNHRNQTPGQLTALPHIKAKLGFPDTAMTPSSPTNTKSFDSSGMNDSYCSINDDIKSNNANSNISSVSSNKNNKVNSMRVTHHQSPPPFPTSHRSSPPSSPSPPPYTSSVRSSSSSNRGHRTTTTTNAGANSPPLLLNSAPPPYTNHHNRAHNYTKNNYLANNTAASSPPPFPMQSPRTMQNIDCQNNVKSGINNSNTSSINTVSTTSRSSSISSNASNKTNRSFSSSSNNNNYSNNNSRNVINDSSFVIGKTTLNSNNRSSNNSSSCSSNKIELEEDEVTSDVTDKDKDAISDDDEADIDDDVTATTMSDGVDSNHVIDENNSDESNCTPPPTFADIFSSKGTLPQDLHGSLPPNLRNHNNIAMHGAIFADDHFANNEQTGFSNVHVLENECDSTSETTFEVSNLSVLHKETVTGEELPQISNRVDSCIAVDNHSRSPCNSVEGSPAIRVKPAESVSNLIRFSSNISLNNLCESGEKNNANGSSVSGANLSQTNDLTKLPLNLIDEPTAESTVSPPNDLMNQMQMQLSSKVTSTDQLISTNNNEISNLDSKTTKTVSTETIDIDGGFHSNRQCRCCCMRTMCYSNQGGNSKNKEVIMKEDKSVGTVTVPASDIIIKIRVEGLDDPDFIEVCLVGSSPIAATRTYAALLHLCCTQLRLTPQHVERIRKLPNTRLRCDADVGRLQEGVELELVLRGNRGIKAHGGSASYTHSPIIY